MVCASSQRFTSALRLHPVNMFRARERAGAHVGGIALDRSLDHRAEIAVAADRAAVCA